MNSKLARQNVFLQWNHASPVLNIDDSSKEAMHSSTSVTRYNLPDVDLQKAYFGLLNYSTNVVRVQTSHGTIADTNLHRCGLGHREHPRNFKTFWTS